MESRSRTADLALQALVASRPSTRVDPPGCAPGSSPDLLVEDEKVGIVAGSGFYLGESCSS